MFGKSRDGSDDNEAVKIVKSLKPFWKKWTEEWGRSCVREKKMTVTTAPSGGVIGVTDAFSSTEMFIKYKPDLSNATVGDVVWCKWMFGNMQTLYADSFVDPSDLPSYLPLTGGTLSGDVTVQKASGSVGFFAERTDTGVRVGLEVGTGGTNHGLYSHKDNRWMIYNDADGVTRLPSATITTVSSTTANLTTANITNANLTNAPTVAGHSSKVGTIKTANLSSNTTIATATNKAIVSISLEAGTWIIVARGRFSANATGYRHINISTTSADNGVHIQVPAVSGAVTQLSVTRIVSITSTTTFYMNAYQNSGSTLTMAAGSGGEINALTAIRIL